MLKLALGEAVTHASVGSFNNHWGVPLSLARMPADSGNAVLELGMNHAGEIAPLTALVRADIAIVTTVEAVHLEFFASTREIAEAKAEIFAGVVPGGIAILPRDNPYYGLLRERAEQAGVKRFATFGTHIEADARLLDFAVVQDQTLVFALIKDKPISYAIGVPGRPWAMNSLAVLLAADAGRHPHRRSRRRPGDHASAQGPRRAQEPALGRGRRDGDRRKLQCQPGLGARRFGDPGQHAAEQRRTPRRRAGRHAGAGRAGPGSASRPWPSRSLNSASIWCSPRVP